MFLETSIISGYVNHLTPELLNKSTVFVFDPPSHKNFLSLSSGTFGELNSSLSLWTFFVKIMENMVLIYFIELVFIRFLE